MRAMDAGDWGRSFSINWDNDDDDLLKKISGDDEKWWKWM